MLEVRFPAANIACPPHPSIARRLREGTFNPCPSTIAQGHAASRGACVGAALAYGAHLAGLFGKENQHDRFAFGILAEIPGTVLLALRTSDLLAFPVNVKLRDIHCAWC